MSEISHIFFSLFTTVMTLSHIFRSHFLKVVPRHFVTLGAILASTVSLTVAPSA